MSPAFMIAEMDGSKVEGSQTLAWPWKLHHAEAFGRNGLQAQNSVEDCAAIVHFWLSGTCEAAAVGMSAVKLPPTIACARDDGVEDVGEYEPESGVGAEEEELVLQNRTADGEAEAVLIVGSLRRR